MKNLYIARHAKSSWDHQGLRDFDRPLNERGLKTAPLMAQLMLRNGIRPDLIVTSPAKRALTTARFFADMLGVDEADFRTEPDMYLPLSLELLQIIRQLPAEKNTVFIFGHNPSFTDLANIFTGPKIDNLPTCGIVHVEVESWDTLGHENGRVTHFYFPKKDLV